MSLSFNYPVRRLRERCGSLVFVLASVCLTLASVAPANAECTAAPKAADLDFVLKDMHGNDVALSDYAGKIVLLDFWATWCAPCRIEIPGFIKLYEAHQAKGFEVLGISIDDPPDALQDYAAELGMSYPVLIGDARDDVKESYGPLIGFPTTFIIDRDGNICHRHIGYAPFEQFEMEILALL